MSGVCPENAPKIPIIAWCNPDGANVMTAIGLPATA